MGKKEAKNTKPISKDKIIAIFKIVLVASTLILFSNTIFNHFSLDDHYINIDNPVISKGISGIPEIWTTPYSTEGDQSYGYRPIVRTTFAIEYQFTKSSPYNPYISHAINVILYILALLLLYQVLRRLFRDYNIWFPFLVTLLFMTHPTHTEVIASLKNRDILLNFIFSFLAIREFIRWVDLNKTRNFIFGVLYFILALLSKETAIAQLAVFPLVLYFFTDIKLKKLFSLIGAAVIAVAAVFIIRDFYLPETIRNLQIWENPLIENENLLVRIGTSMYVIGHYLKMLLIPWPLVFYYGYNMIPISGFTSPWVILSTVVTLALIIYSLKYLKSKSLLSFTILYFFVNISMYTNIVAVVPGIVADRFLFFPSLSFSIFIVWLILTLLKVDIKTDQIKTKSIVITLLLLMIFILPYSYYTIIRNKQWKTTFTLYNSDIGRLENSVKANAIYAHELMRRVNRELAKPVNAYKFIMGTIEKADKHYSRVIELDSTHYKAYNNLGILYSRIHGNQALMRVTSHQKRNEPDKVLEETDNARKYFAKAVNYFHKAIKYNPDFASPYFNLGYSYDLQNKFDSAIIYYKKATEIDSGMISSMSKLANAYFRNGQPQSAIDVNKKIIEKYPESDQPYVNLGNYYIQFADTVRAMQNFEIAAKLGNRPEVSKLLSQYYSSIGDNNKANYYKNKAYEDEKKVGKK